jgi:hypothetical protein
MSIYSSKEKLRLLKNPFWVFGSSLLFIGIAHSCGTLRDTGLQREDVKAKTYLNEGIKETIARSY